MVKRFLYRIICGFFLGISVFAPGFSGSFIAIVMGVYQDILRIISNPFKDFKKNVLFCVPVGIGVAVSAVLFLIVFKFLFETYEKATYLLFAGLIAGNLPVIVGDIKKIGFQKRYLIGALSAFAAALLLGIYGIGAGQLPLSVGVSSGFLWLAIGGFAGGAVALIPGMSVSIVLMIFGVYGQMLFAAESLLHFNFAYLIHFAVFCAGALAGLVLASSGIKVVFKKFPGFANSMVLGFMSGSLIALAVDSLQMADPGFTWLLGGIMLAAGLCISMLFVVMGKKMNRD